MSGKRNKTAADNKTDEVDLAMIGLLNNWSDVYRTLLGGQNAVAEGIARAKSLMTELEQELVRVKAERAVAREGYEATMGVIMQIAGLVGLSPSMPYLSSRTIERVRGLVEERNRLRAELEQLRGMVKATGVLLEAQ